MRSIRKYHELIDILNDKKALLFPSYCSTKALKIVSLNGFQRYLFILTDEWLSMLSLKRGERLTLLKF
jgi:hypothetical protein